jgi:hypothetical protein
MSDPERDDGDRDDEDTAWLLAKHSGQPGDHPRAAHYAELEQLLADLPPIPGGARLRPGWEHGVLAAIDAGAAPTPLRRVPRWAIASIGLAAAAIVAIAIPWLWPHGDAPVVALSYTLVSADPAHPTRGVGDLLVVRGHNPGPGELRIYDHAGVEQARCAATSDSCELTHTADDTMLQLSLRLRAPGELLVVLYTAPLGGLARGRDADLDAATQARIPVKTLPAIDVR